MLKSTHFFLANTDDQVICARFPTSALCRDQKPNQQNPQRVSSNDDTSSYCAKWEKHFDFYCGGLGNGDQRANEFCPYYRKTCNIKTKPLFVTPPPLPPSNGASHGVPNSAGGGSQSQSLPQPPPPPPSQPQAHNQPQTFPPQPFNQPQQQQQQSFLQPQTPPQPQPAPAPSSFGQGAAGGLSNVGQPLGFLGGANSAIAGTPQGVPGAGAPLGIGQGFGVGPFANAFQGTNINPLSGVSSGTSINAAGLPISSNRGVSFGGLIPGGLSNIFGG